MDSTEWAPVLGQAVLADAADSVEETAGCEEHE